MKKNIINKPWLIQILVIIGFILLLQEENNK